MGAVSPGRQCGEIQTAGSSQLHPWRALLSSNPCQRAWVRQHRDGFRYLQHGLTAEVWDWPPDPRFPKCAITAIRPTADREP